RAFKNNPDFHIGRDLNELGVGPGSRICGIDSNRRYGWVLTHHLRLVAEIPSATKAVIASLDQPEPLAQLQRRGIAGILLQPTERFKLGKPWRKLPATSCYWRSLRNTSAPNPMLVERPVLPQRVTHRPGTLRMRFRHTAMKES